MEQSFHSFIFSNSIILVRVTINLENTLGEMTVHHMHTHTKEQFEHSQLIY